MTVIVGTDGSDGAERAVDTAARIADAFGDQLVVVSGHRDQEYRRSRAEGEEISLEAGDGAAQLVEASLGRVRAAFPSLIAVGRVEEGKPAEAIVGVADELQARLIVVGNRRVQGVSRVLGSIASDVARKATCDVYVAHTQE